MPDFRWLAAFALATVAALAGCDVKRIAELEVGVTTDEPGWDKAQVRRLLGRAAKTQTYSQKQEEVWDWRFADGAESKVFSVSFDMSGRVVSTSTTLDAKEAGQAGR